MARGGFPGMGGNMQQLMRQAQKMQQDVANLQEEIGSRNFTVTVGGGMVTAVVNGRKEFQSIAINPECVDPNDVEMLQDLILSAVNEAVRTAEETMTNEMNKITGGMNIGF